MEKVSHEKQTGTCPIGSDWEVLTEKRETLAMRAQDGDAGCSSDERNAMFIEDTRSLCMDNLEKECVARAKKILNFANEWGGPYRVVK